MSIIPLNYNLNNFKALDPYQTKPHLCIKYASIFPLSLKTKRHYVQKGVD